MLCRTAEDIFWMSRYVERAVAVARVLDVTWNLELDAGHLAGTDVAFWAGLLDAPGGDEPWHFICLGRYLERADTVARALALEAQLLRGGEGARGDELVRWLVVL